jgi:hypothetical protein
MIAPHNKASDSTRALQDLISKSQPQISTDGVAAILKVSEQVVRAKFSKSKMPPNLRTPVQALLRFLEHQSSVDANALALQFNTGEVEYARFKDMLDASEKIRLQKRQDEKEKALEHALRDRTITSGTKQLQQRSILPSNADILGKRIKLDDESRDLVLRFDKMGSRV